MLIQIDKLKRRPRQISIDEQATSFPFLKDLIEDGVVVFNATIKGTCKATWVRDAIEVDGQLATSVTIPCCRCLMPVVSQLDIPVKLSYAGNDNEESPVVEEIELQGEEISLIPFSGTEIDLRLDLDQEIIMALPQRSLCQETCRGLCSVCGCNLNNSSCECEPPVFHAGLAALKKLKIE